MDLVIRPARPDDRPALIEFNRALQEAERSMHPSRLPGNEVAAFAYQRLLDQHAEILIAEAAGKPVGFVSGWIAEDDDPLQTGEWRRHGYISDIFVASEWRRKRVAQILLDAIAALLESLGAKRLRICALACNSAAIESFKRFGFEPFEVTFDKVLG